MSLNTSAEVVSVSIIAGPITRSSSDVGSFGTLVRMGDGNIYFQITAETARQWLPVIEQIAEGE